MNAILRLFGLSPTDNEIYSTQTPKESGVSTIDDDDDDDELGYKLNDDDEKYKCNSIEDDRPRPPSFYDWRELFPVLEDLQNRYVDILEEAKSIHQWIPWPEDHYSKEIKGDDTQDNDEEGNSGACSLLNL